MILTKQKIKNALMFLFESGFNETLDQKETSVEEKVKYLRETSGSGDYELNEDRLRELLSEAFDKGFRGCLELKEEHAFMVADSLEKRKRPEKSYIDYGKTWCTSGTSSTTAWVTYSTGSWS